jgi:Concanavalin A-like lectin/glucanases superfamily
MSGDLWTLRLLIDLYHAHHLASDYGVLRGVIRGKYARKKFGEQGLYSIWGFKADSRAGAWEGPLLAHRARKHTKGEDHPLWQSIAKLERMGLLAFIPHLFANSDPDTEPVHTLGATWQGAEPEEELIRNAAIAAGKATLLAADIPVMVASGASHAKGAAPDPGATAGTTKFLREDATWAVPAGGSSLYFGQGFATASTTTATITLGSTPVTASAVSVFINGSIQPQSAYSISGGVITLATPATSGNVVVVTWVTTNSTPGGVALGSLSGAGWKMDEGSGLILHDSIGSNDATINTGPSVTWTANSIKSGVTSPVWNASGYALASNATPTNFDGTAPFSVAVWFKANAVGGQTLLGNMASASGFKGWSLEIQQTGGNFSPLFILINTSGSNQLGVLASTSYATGGLHYLVATYDGSRTAAGAKLYVDGSLVSVSGLFDSLTASTASGLPVRFGARDNATNKFNGAMAYDQIFNVALTSTQISAFFAAGPQLN